MSITSVKAEPHMCENTCDGNEQHDVMDIPLNKPNPLHDGFGNKFLVLLAGELLLVLQLS